MFVYCGTLTQPMEWSLYEGVAKAWQAWEFSVFYRIKKSP